MLKDLVLKNRSYRRFYQEVPIKRAGWEEKLRGGANINDKRPNT
jgi:hypothetical protein